VRTFTKEFLNTRTGLSQPPVAPYAGCLIITTNKTKTQTQSSADRTTPSPSLAHQRWGGGGNLLQISPHMKLTTYTNHWTKLRRAEINRKIKSNLAAWEKEISNTIHLKK